MKGPQVPQLQAGSALAFRLSGCAALLLAAWCLLLPQPVLAKVVHSEKSLYRNIVVDERQGRRCMQFTVRRDQRNQSCMDIKEPRKLVFSYTRMMMAGLLLVPEPERVLMIGLGGGTIATALAELYPNAIIDVVEIDPAVVRVAQDYFDYQDRAGIRTHVGDGRIFVKRAAMRGASYDMVILDAFTGDYIPEHMVTLEFLQETRSLLTSAGVVVANTFKTSRLVDHESATYHAVFGSFWDLQLPNSNNRILLAPAGTGPAAVGLDQAEASGNSELQARSRNLQRRLRRYGVHPDVLLNGMRSNRPWDQDARILTDQFAPANLLRAES